MADQPGVRIPGMCEAHRHDLLVHMLRLTPDDQWRVPETIAYLLLTQGATADARIWKRAGGRVENLSIVFAEIGCLACWDTTLYDRMVRVLQKGNEYAADVSQGKRDDPDFPKVMPATLHPPNENNT